MVVNEMTSSHAKSKNISIELATIALATLAFVSYGSLAEANYIINANKNENDSSLDKSIVIGSGSGGEEKAQVGTLKSSVAIGQIAQTLGTVEDTVIIGRQTITNASKTVNLGALTDTRSQYGVAVGYKSWVQENAEGGLAIGGWSRVSAEGGVALGYDSIASRGMMAGYNPMTNSSSTDSAIAWKATTGAVSIGSDSVSRQLTGLAAGSADNDAVNVAQLKALQNTIPGITVNGGLEPGNITGNLRLIKNTDETKDPQRTYDLSLAPRLALGDETNGGGSIKVNSKRVNNIPEYIDINGQSLFIYGSEGAVKLTDKGLDIYGESQNVKEISITNDHVSFGNQTIHNIGNATLDTDAVNFRQLKDYAVTLSANATPASESEHAGSGNIRIKKEVDSNGKVNYDLKTADTLVLTDANGSNLTAGIDISNNRGNTSFKADGLRIGYGVSSGAELKFTSDGIAAGNQQIKAVAAGTEQTDAVNFGQLKDYAVTLSANATPASESEHSGSGNIRIKKEVDSNGKVNYDLKTADRLVLSDTTGTANPAGIFLERHDGSTKGLSSFTADGLRIGYGVPTGTDLKFTNNGIAAGNQQIKAVAAGTELTDAVNLGQLQETVKGSEINILTYGQPVTEENYGDSYILARKITKDGKTNYDFRLNNHIMLGEDPSDPSVAGYEHGDGLLQFWSNEQANTGKFTQLNSQGLTLAGDNPAKFTSEGISAGNQKITEVAAATENTDAVNLGQLTDLLAENGTIGTKITVDGLDEKTTGNLTLASSLDEANKLKTYDLSLSNNLDLTETGSLSIGESSLTSSGLDIGSGALQLSSTGLALKDGPTFTSTGIDAGNLSITNAKGTLWSDTDEGFDQEWKNVATLGDLYKYASNTSDTQPPLSFGADSGTAIDASKTQVININGSENIQTSVTDGAIKVALNKDVNLSGGSIQFAENGTNLSNEGLKINDKLSITNNGISAGNKQITNVASGNGSWTDAEAQQNWNNVATIGDLVKAKDNFVVGTLNQSVVTVGGSEVSAENPNVTTDRGLKLSYSETTNDDGTKKTGFDLDLSDNIKLGSNEQAGSLTLFDKDVGQAAITVAKDSAGSTRLSYSDGTTDRQLATTDDGLTLAADDGNTVKASLNNQVGLKGDGNITTKVEDGNLVMAMNDHISVSSLALKPVADESVLPNEALYYVPTMSRAVADETGHAGRMAYKDSNGVSHQLATLNDGFYVGNGGTDASQSVLVAMNSQLDFVGQDGIETSIRQEANKTTVTFKLKDIVPGGNSGGSSGGNSGNGSGGGSNSGGSDVNAGKVTVGDTVINNTGVVIASGDKNYQDIRIEQKNVNMGGNRIQNIGDGVAPTDAVNVRQLQSASNRIMKKINDVDKDARAGIAQAIATAGLPQAYLPGKNMLAAAAGTYHGQSAIAMGLSSVTDNGKWVFKGSVSGDTRGNFGGAIGVGFQF